MTDDDLEVLRREVEDLRDQLATTRHDVEQVDARTVRKAPSRPVRREPDRRPQWMKDTQAGARRRGRSLWYRTKRALVIGTVYITAAGLVSIDPFEWFQPADCGGAEKSASVQAQPAAVKIATDQGKMLRRLAGPPPTPEQTNKVATEAADAVVVTVLAFLASAKDKPEPAKVTAYNTAHAKQAAAKEAQSVAACVPECPPGAPGPVTVAHAPGITGEPATIAARITAVGRAMGIPDQGIVIAIAAARQESGLRNLTYGDRDSLGVFQQRGSWGTAAQRTNPEWAARAFYQALQAVPGWQSMPVTVAAQAVQRSAYPGAYADDEGVARAVLSGQSAAAPCVGASASTYKTGAGAAWGGYTNGRIPATALAHPKWAPRHSLRPDAAAAFDQLSAAYNARFGRGLGVTDSYRSYEGQVRTKAAKGNLAAKPGTSNHGWGLAIDAITGGYGDARYLWLRANAPRFGWDNPGWARPGGSKNEPWHWEFNPTGART